MPKAAVPELPELTPQVRMAMEKETTGLYLTGHPMDGYREQLNGLSVAPIGAILESFANKLDDYRDEQIVRIAGIVQSVKMKTTKNNTMMAYVTLEDDTAAIEMLVFSGALRQYGGNLHENAAIVVQGKLSVRDEKDPQLILNAARPIADYADGDVLAADRRQDARAKTLYLKLPSATAPDMHKILPLLRMFPGETRTVLYYADTGVRMGGKCSPDEDLLRELRELLGDSGVVLKE